MCLQKILKNIVKVSEDDVGPHREARHLQSCPDYIGDIKIIDLQSIKVYIFSTAQMSGALVGKGRGRERPAGERSPVAGQDNREKLGQKGRFPLVVIFSCPCNNFMLNSNGLNIKFPLQLINFLARFGP